MLHRQLADGLRKGRFEQRTKRVYHNAQDLKTGESKGGGVIKRGEKGAEDERQEMLLTISCNCYPYNKSLMYSFQQLRKSTGVYVGHNISHDYHVILLVNVF